MGSKLTAGDLRIIMRTDMLRGLKREAIERIVAPATALTLKVHDSLCRQGEPANAFFIVIDGWVKLYRITISGDDPIVEVVTKGDSFAEAAALTDDQFFISAEAVTEARVARIPADHAVRCIRESPDIALALVTSASQHVHHLMQVVEQLKAQSGIQRAAKFLVSLSFVDHGPCDIVLPYNKALIASRLGLNPESLSRAFSKLKSLGVSVLASHVAIKDIAKLHQLISDDRSALSRGTLRTTPQQYCGGASFMT